MCKTETLAIKLLNSALQQQNYSSFCHGREEEIKMKRALLKKRNVHTSVPRGVVAPKSKKITNGQLFCNHLLSPSDCMTSEACEKSEQNLKIPDVKGKRGRDLNRIHLGFRDNWVAFKFFYLEGVCVCGHSDKVVTGLMTALTI